MPGKAEKKAETQKKEQMVHLDPALKTVFADKVQLLMRADGLAILRWIQDFPEFSSEVARVIVTQDHLKRIIDLLCQNTGHYPTPDEGSGKAE